MPWSQSLLFKYTGLTKWMRFPHASRHIFPKQCQRLRSKDKYSLCLWGIAGKVIEPCFHNTWEVHTHLFGNNDFTNLGLVKGSVFSNVITSICTTIGKIPNSLWTLIQPPKIRFRRHFLVLHSIWSQDVQRERSYTHEMFIYFHSGIRYNSAL